MTEDERLALPYRPNVGLMVVNAAGHIFAGQRLDNPGAWQMPQGGIDAGETPREAALRELVEETGIAPDMVNILGETADWHSYDFPPELAAKLWKGGFRGQKQKWFLLRFTGDNAEINIHTEEPEFSVWEWMKPNILLNKIVPFKRDIYEAVFADFRAKY